MAKILDDNLANQEKASQKEATIDRRIALVFFYIIYSRLIWSVAVWHFRNRISRRKLCLDAFVGGKYKCQPGAATQKYFLWLL